MFHGNLRAAAIVGIWAMARDDAVPGLAGDYRDPRAPARATRVATR